MGPGSDPKLGWRTAHAASRAGGACSRASPLDQGQHGALLGGLHPTGSGCPDAGSQLSDVGILSYSS